ncbi:hypothetical protein SUGI_0417790 [Cryptomeria japonica]|uniref:pentatricopeptide repeat-containing protein At1g69290 n=1 Tax=Cryptomeria japonica TaxID=3369 RepID=UPI00240894BB|nr:pentatricopeptide repeat-containing protein At1g69290 [Cryptomeria japonica]GLJ22226.1 hypothetical protein SUGI_0417790 [Cryptomeria japonica]
MRERLVQVCRSLLLSNYKSSILWAWQNASALANRRSCLCSDSNAKIPFTYSFLQPNVFAAVTHPPPPNLSVSLSAKNEQSENKVDISVLEEDLEIALDENRLNDAWKAFKLMRNNGVFPSKISINRLVKELASANDLPGLKRAFATAILVLEKHPHSMLDMESIPNLVSILERAKMLAPTSSLIRAMLKNGFRPHLNQWSRVVEQMSKIETAAPLALEIFWEICHLVRKEGALVDQMKPDTAAFNAALNACLTFGSVVKAEGLLKTMPVLGLTGDGRSFGIIAQLYAKKGLKEKIERLDKVMNQYKVSPDQQFYSSLVSAYLGLGDLESASENVLLMLKRACSSVGRARFESGDECSELNTNVFPDEQIYCLLVKGYLELGTVKDLARFLIKAQDIEEQLVALDQTACAGIIHACINLGWLEKAHSILDEMIAHGTRIGIGVFSSLLKAYCKDQRTAEATQLVSNINMAGLELDAGSYDTVIDVCMTAQDFKAAFGLFREMREAGVGSLKTSYLTIMTGLTENHRPELMAAFLDEVVVDPRVGVGVHDWNSIIHSFCKLGRLEDARRTFKRMAFLRFEPNAQSYLSLVNGYCAAEKYFSVLLLWAEMKKRMAHAQERGIEALTLNRDLIDAFLLALVKGGFFDAAMEVVEKMQELKIFVDKWRYKHVYLETHKKLKLARLKKKSFQKVQAIIAFKNWVGLST